jgi:phosphoenolpyruvate-protein kinase (PTS system EI component)
MAEARIWDKDKWGTKAQFHSVEFFNSRIRELFHERVRNSGKPWEEVVYSSDVAITREDIQKIEDDLMATGFRYQYSAQISIVEDPEKYAITAGKKDGEVSAEEELMAANPDAGAAGEAPHEEGGRLVVGTGQNVLRQKQDVSGIIRFISTTERVMEMVLEGVPEDTIAVIDDSGGTLTAPIIEGFKGILCLGGTVRSHLGILAREYGIPCLMDCRIQGLHEGDRVEVEYTAAPPPATQAHVASDENRANIWKIKGSA